MIEQLIQEMIGIVLTQHLLTWLARKMRVGELDQHTIKNKFHTPVLEELINELGGS